MLTPNQLTELLSQMTLEEKIGMVHGDGFFRTKGIKRLHIPPLKMSDGPMGVRQEFPDNNWEAKALSDDYMTYFLSNTALAATWNEQHAYTFGQALGAETRSRGKDVILAPGVNIIRSPFCGRNFEYMSEDPYLTSKMAVPLIQGIQENDVAACVKHFVANNQETNRLTVNAEISQRALEEIYYPAFEASVKEGGSYTVMGAYNRVNGDYCCESPTLLQSVLRDRWGFDGIVISDWGACHSTKKAAMAGLDIEMSVTPDFDDYYFANHFYERIENGSIPVSVLDQKVLRILTLMNRLKMLDGDRQSGSRNTYAHQLSTLKAAEESIVLLENKENFLPLSKDSIQSILLVGENAEKLHAKGGGSAEIKALYEHSPLAGIRMFLGGNIKITYTKGYTSEKKEDPSVNLGLRMEASRLALSHDLIIFVGGLNHEFDVEGNDRSDYQLPYQQDLLIEALSIANPNLITINLSGSAVDLTTAKTYSKALLQTWYNGMEGGRALAHVLFGEVNPSGKLPFTFAKSVEDYGSHALGEFSDAPPLAYKDAVYVGYRYFDSYLIDPLYAFGHGLSYTLFTYSHLTVNPLDNYVQVALRLTNAGSILGKEVVQLYIHDHQPSANPRIERPYR